MADGYRDVDYKEKPAEIALGAALDKMTELAQQIVQQSNGYQPLPMSDISQFQRYQEYFQQSQAAYANGQANNPGLGGPVTTGATNSIYNTLLNNQFIMPPGGLGSWVANVKQKTPYQRACDQFGEDYALQISLEIASQLTEAVKNDLRIAIRDNSYTIDPRMRHDHTCDKLFIDIGVITPGNPTFYIQTWAYGDKTISGSYFAQSSKEIFSGMIKDVLASEEQTGDGA